MESLLSVPLKMLLSNTRSCKEQSTVLTVLTCLSFWNFIYFSCNRSDVFIKYLQLLSRTENFNYFQDFFQRGGGKWRRASDSQWDDGIDQQAANGMMALTSMQPMGWWRWPAGSQWDIGGKFQNCKNSTMLCCSDARHITEYHQPGSYNFLLYFLIKYR
jgi:hypothetical protein